MKKLLAFWWHEPNFGDVLSPYLITKLSGCRVIYNPIHRPFFKVEWKRFWSHPLQFDWARMRWPSKKTTILAIGSMLEHSKPYHKIWGTGFLKSTSQFNGGEVFAVRGPYSAKIIASQGYPFCKIYGDPALLLPLVYKPKQLNEHYRFGIIPHQIEYKEFNKIYPDSKLIDLTTNNVESVIDQIYSCDYILTTSLHGIIVAHAYGIPAVHIKGEKNIGGDGIKFRDYFNSVGLSECLPTYSVEGIIKLAKNDPLQFSKVVTLPNSERIKEIQKQLLVAAPFTLNREFVNI